MFYNNNHYNDFYLFSRPDLVANGAKAVKNYELCKSYIVKNPTYQIARNDPTR